MLIILFRNEKYFTVNPIINSRTCKYIAKGRAKDASDHVRLVQTSKCPTQIMMFGLVASNDLKRHPVFLPIGLQMAAKEYLELMLNTHVLLWIQVQLLQHQ